MQEPTFTPVPPSIWQALIDGGEQFIKVGGVITGVAGLLWLTWHRAVKPMWHLGQNVLHILGGVQTLLEDVGKIKAEFSPNGGGSARDQWLRIEERQHKFECIQRAMMDQDSHGHADATVTGDVVWVNSTLVRWTGLDAQDLLGWDWLVSIHERYRKQVELDVASAVKYQRNYRGDFALCSVSGDVRFVTASAEAIRSRRTDAVSGWIITVKEREPRRDEEGLR